MQTSPRLTLLLGLLFALTALGVDSFLPAMPAIAIALHAEPSAVQLAVTTFLLGIASGQLFWGPLSDRFGRRPAFLGGLSVFLVASLLCAQATSVDAIVALRFVQGLGMSSGPVVSRSVVRDLFAHEQAARLLASMMVVFGLVPTLSPLVTAALIGFGWHAVFWFHAFMAAALMASVYLSLAETAPAIGTAIAPTALARRFRQLLADRRFVGPLAVLLCAQAGVLAFVSSGAFVLVQRYGVSPRGFALCFSAVMVGQISGAWVSSRLVVRHGIPRMLRVGVWIGFGASVPLALLAWADVAHWSAVVVPMAVFMFSASINISNSAAAALTPFPAIAGSASALLGFLQFGTGALMSAILAAGFAGDARAMTGAILLTALGAVLAERLLYRPALAWTA